MPWAHVRNWDVPWSAAQFPNKVENELLEASHFL
jgi:hypothetical protein